MWKFSFYLLFYFLFNCYALNTTDCNVQLCLPKCYNERKIVVVIYDGTMKTMNKTDLANATFTIEDIDERLSNVTKLKVYRKIGNDFEVTEKQYVETSLNNRSLLFFLESEYRSYLTEDGYYYEERPNFYNHWLEIKVYCIDYIIYMDEQNKTDFKPYVGLAKMYEPDGNDINEADFRLWYSTSGAIISCIFLVLTLIVYSILPELRNIAGLVMIGTVITYLATFLLLTIETVVVRGGDYTDEFCIFISIAIYYCYLSYFFWTTVMSFDMWRSFRSIHYGKIMLSRKGKRIRFSMYCMFAWGVPFLMAAFVEILENKDLTSTPGFLKPHLHDYGSCFFSSYSVVGMEKFLYLFLPALCLIFISSVMCCLNLRTIWMVRKDINNMNSKKNDNYKNSIVYLKLAAITGVTWILDMVIYYLPPDEYTVLKYISDTYNMLSGVVLFFIFVFRKRIFILLCKKYTHWQSQRSRRSSRKTSTMSSINNSYQLDNSVKKNNRQSFKLAPEESVELAKDKSADDVSDTTVVLL